MQIYKLILIFKNAGQTVRHFYTVHIIFLFGGADGTYAMIGIVEKGYGDVKFVAKGNAGHSSVPAKNIPLVRLGKFMTYVEKH